MKLKVKYFFLAKLYFCGGSGVILDSGKYIFPQQACFNWGVILD
jgi:hypothetical protein